jgi:phosphatidylglycerophosphate synthase
MRFEQPESPTQNDRRWLLAGIPNTLTVIRLAIGLVYLFLPVPARLPALLVAAATEFLDGVLARWLRARSLTGQILDPIADKIFVLAALLTLVGDGVLAWWWFVLVEIRDIAVAIGTLTVSACRGFNNVELMRPRALGKLATTAQLLLLLSGVVLGEISDPLLALTVGLSAGAGYDYVRQFW